MLESFLRRILRRTVEQKVEKAVDNAVEQAVDQAVRKPLQSAIVNAAQQTPQNANAGTSNAGTPNAGTTEESGSEWDIEYSHDIAYFRDIIKRNFPEYTVEENVPFSTLVSAATSVSYPPYTFVFRKDGAAVLVISLQSKYHYRKGLHTYCEWKAGIRHLNFFAEYPDREDYVVDRIRQAL